MSHGWVGSLQHRGKEDRSSCGSIQKGDRYAEAFVAFYVFIFHDCLIRAYFLGLRIKETKEVYEGEVTELTPAEAENPLSGYGKTVSHVIVGLKTVKGTKQLRLDPTIYEAMLKEKIVVGDVIYIEANTGAVKVRLCCTKRPRNF